MRICDYLKSEIEYISEECNFTEDERMVFKCLSKGNTIEHTSEECNLSVSTVKRIKRRIKAKIERLTNF